MFSGAKGSSMVLSKLVVSFGEDDVCCGCFNVSAAIVATW